MRSSNAPSQTRRPDELLFTRASATRSGTFPSRASRKVPLLALLLPAALAVVTADDAEACGGIRMEVEDAKVLLVQAERQLEEGLPMKAAITAARTLGAERSWSETWWRSRILATASIRSAGRVSPYAWTDHRLGGDREQNLAAAVGMLERMRKNDLLREDPTLLAALGEGLAQLPGREDNALQMLTSLADKDVLPSPSAWAALSRLRAQKGLVEEAKLARSTCEAMLGDERKGACTTAMLTAGEAR